MWWGKGAFLYVLLLILILLLLDLFMTDYLLSVWLLSSPYGRSDFWLRVCQFIACMCMCCMCVNVCVTSTVVNVSVCIACLVSSVGNWELVAPWSSWCVLLCVWVWERESLVMLAPVFCLHDSRCSCGVLLCADAWSVCVRCERLCLCSDYRPRLWGFLMPGPLWQKMLHNALNVPFWLWISGIT